jgi:replicative superfamily II helicase
MKPKDILSRLYDYQLDAVKATDKSKKGIVCMPTGTGKTFVQASIIAKEILKNKGQFGIYVINSPRIMLSYQLLKEVYSFLMYAVIDARYMSVHSGGQNDLEDLVNAISEEDAIALNEWFCNPSELNKPSYEYIKFSVFFMAFEYAKSIIKNRSNEPFL